MHAINVLYPQGDLNEAYYASTHGPLVKEKLTPVGLRRFYYQTIGPGPDGSPPPFRMVAHLVFDDLASLQRAMASPEMRAVVGDVKNFYSGRIQVLIGEIHE